MTTRLFSVLAGALFAFASVPSTAQVLAYDIAVAEAETGRVRHLAERLNKQNVLYQLHLGGATRNDVVRTAKSIDRIIKALEEGNPAQTIPAPWSPEIRARVDALDRAWGPLREIAVASPYDYLRRGRVSSGDPMRLRYVDDMTRNVVAAAGKLMALHDQECRKTEQSELCEAATAAHYASMLSERAMREAVLVFAGLEAEENIAKLKKTVELYDAGQERNKVDPFLRAALSPERGEAAEFAAKLLANLRSDWDEQRAVYAKLSKGGENDFDVDRLLQTQEQMVTKLDRFTASMVRFANVTYGR